MTAEQAAYECMQRVTRRIGYENLTVEFVETVEREFTEIISQVTPPDEINKRFNECIAKLGDVHARLNENRLTDYQGGAAGRNPADLQNGITGSAGLVHRAPPTPVERWFHELQVGATRQASGVMDASFHEEALRRKNIALAQLDQTCGRFPQEIVEPQPKPWWKRWIG